jgi:hypothetical protein
MHQGHVQTKTCVQRQGYACKGRASMQRPGVRRQGCMCEDGGTWEDRVGGVETRRWRFAVTTMPVFLAVVITAYKAHRYCSTMGKYQ